MLVTGQGSLRPGNTLPLTAIFLTIILTYLALVKIPPAIDSDIQPWDEGMYAARVNSIHINGDFFDQSSHSVGRFYSGAHPPLLIWTGYLTSLIFGFSPATLKLLMVFISLCAVFMVYLVGKEFMDPFAGILASVIFSGNILFNVFSKRFQLDVFYLLFMLLSFYFILRLYRSNNLFNTIAAGIFFGLCMLSKILVGFFIPLVMGVSILAVKGKSSVRLKDFLIVTAVGIAIALPWHVYMMATYGKEFTDVFFGFHLIDRAFAGVELNQKASGPLYYFNYFLSIVPYGILLLFAFVSAVRNSSRTSYSDVLMWTWVILGFLILTIFRTKLESYLLLVLPAASVIIAKYINSGIEKEKSVTVTLIMTLVMLNWLWFATEDIRPLLKVYASEQGIAVSLAMVLVIAGGMFMLSRKLVAFFNMKFAMTSMIVITFLIANLNYLLNRPLWEDRFRISSIVSAVERHGAEKIVYIGSGYRYNPQFSYYFKGIDLGWKNPPYAYELMDTNIGEEKISARLQVEDPSSIVLVERDKINRSDYPPSHTFMPDNYEILEEDTGYELYKRFR